MCVKPIVNSIVKASVRGQLILFLGVGFYSAPAIAKLRVAGAPSAQEQAFIQATQAALQLSHVQREQIWKGFDLTDYPLIYYTPHKGFSYALLFKRTSVTENELLQGFLPVAGYAGVYEGLTLKPYPQFSMNYPMGTSEGLVLDTSLSPVFLIHEAFHRYQSSKSFVSEGVVSNTHYNAEDMALAQLEQKALASALEAYDNAEMRGHLYAFLNLRNTRNQRHSESFTLNENTLEAVEGTAFYVQSRFSQLAYQAKVKSLSSVDPYQLKEMLQQKLVNALSNPLNKQLMEMFRYSMTGCAMGQLLDRLDDSWQAKMELGETLLNLLQTASNYVIPEQKLMFRVLTTPEFKAQKAKQTAYLQVLAEKNKTFVQAFKNAQGQRIEVRFPNVWEMTMSMVESVERPENHRFLDKYATVSVEAPPAVSFFLNGPIEQIDEEEQTFIFYATALDLLTIAGKSVLNQTGAFAGALELRAGETRIQAKNARLVIDETGVKIYILE